MQEEMEFRRRFEASQGYLKLDMVNEAWDEMNGIESFYQNYPEVMQLRVWLLMKRKEWIGALETAQKLCQMLPDIAVPFLDAAYCLHELHNTEAAREVLLSGPSDLKHYPTYHYNLACYEAHLGHFNEAKQYLERAILMNPKFRDEAKADPDLKSLKVE